MKISHIAASSKSGLFVTGAYERQVVVWDFERRHKRLDIDTVLDFGGDRLAILGGDQPVVIAGAYHRFGVCAYDVNMGGAKIWWRRDLKQVQNISVCEKRGLVAVGRDRHSLMVLNAYTGETVGTIRGGRWGRFGPTPDRILSADELGLKTWIASISSGQTIMKMRTDRSWCGAWNEDAIVVNEEGIDYSDIDARGQARVLHPPGAACFGLDGTLRWRAEAGPETHFIEVAWSPTPQAWYVIEGTEGGPGKLKGFSRSGEPLLIGDRKLGIDVCFFLNASYLIDDDGTVCELPSLTPVWRFL